MSSEPQDSPLELTSKIFPPSRTMVIDSEPSKYTYPIQITNPMERESWIVNTDHCYARPWNWRPESSFLKPTKALFMPKNPPKPLFAVGGSVKVVDEEIDVVGEVDVPIPSYDVDKAKALMEECERHASLARNSIDDDNWEERILKTNWSHSQHRLFNGFVNILNSFYLGKMTYSGMKNEPVLRRVVIDKAVQRVRRLFTGISYDTKLLQWIHQLLLDNLDQQNLSSYLDILQTLRSKIPKFIEKLLNTPSSVNRMGPLNNENLLPLLKRPWDPVDDSLAQDKPKKLPSNPIIVLMPCSPNMTKHNQRWYNLLSNLGQVMMVPTNFGSASHRMTLTNCIDQMFSLARGRIQEVRENYPGRHIILAGVGAGATLALQVAEVENVFCVVSLGFSILTAEGRRGEPDDALLELQCPVLFVIGQCSSTSSQEDMEDLRERMRIETGLIVVGSADNNLIVNKKKRREEGITQSIVNRCIVDEIGEFISSLILSPYPPQVRQSPVMGDASSKKGKLERKRFNSTTSSLESEPPSPTPRITRPVGRPAGKSKCKLEAKWAAQVAQGTSASTNPSTAPTPTLPAPDQSGASPSSSDTATASDTTPSASPHKSGDLRKVRTLKPFTSNTTAEKSGAEPGGGVEQARIQAYNLGRNVAPAGQLSTLLQGGIKTIPAMQQKTGTAPTIKVLENVQLSSQATAKLISNSSGRTIDLSKLGLSPRTTGSNVVLLPDGKIKTVPGNRPIVLSVAGRGGKRTTKFITSRKPQSPRPMLKKHAFVPFAPPIKTSLPPPTNLTTQDIMDLPIIFADDNQILEPTDLSTTGTPATAQQIQSPPPPTTKFVSISTAPTTNKFLLVNKPTAASGLSNFIITPTATVKRPNPVPVTKQPTKYTKIILSKKSVEPLTTRLPSTGSLELSEPIDLETELVATAVPKPSVQGGGADKSMGIVSKKGSFDPNEQIYGGDDDDPDYVPPKNLKL